MTSRATFDAFLTEKALEAGSEIVDANPVLKVETDPSHVEITTKNGRYRSQLVIGADGINGPTARSTHLYSRWKPPQIAYAIESEVMVGERAVLDFVGANCYFDLYFGVSPAGYGWVFPKKDHLTIGIGCRLSELCDARLLFEVFAKTIPFLKCFRIPCPKAHLIPLGGAARVPIAGNRVMLAGDSAGFAEPFLGEGIYFAILSGQMAAKAATNACQNDKYSAKSLHQYETECMQMFGKDLQVAYRLACFSYLEQYDMKRLARFFLSEKRVQECMIGLMDGTIRYRDARIKLMWPCLKYRFAKLGFPLYNE
jgi:flavin-dependent dehydrogenase